MTMESGNYKCSLNSVVGGQLVEANLSPKGNNLAAAKDTPAVREAGSWLDAIINDISPVVTAAQACIVTEILEAIYQSAETGKTVYFN